jgi:5-methylcytosine-specific restriction protein B
MENKAVTTGTDDGAFWFVGALYDGKYDQIPRFLEEGIWENGYKDKYLNLVKSMKPGDRIAIKAAYTRRNGLPFPSTGISASVMAIKVIGTILENFGDGRRVRVKWEPLLEPREWYFFTSRSTVWKVVPNEPRSIALVDFTFNNVPQPYTQFLEDPYWKDRYAPKVKFTWVDFYEELATRLLDFRFNRTELIKGVYEHISEIGYLKDEFPDGRKGRLEDICPFSVFGIFNRGIGNEKRNKVILEFKSWLGLSTEVPKDFEGVPVLSSLQSMFFRFANERGSDDIDKLWAVFSAAISMADSDLPEGTEKFSLAYDDVKSVRGVAWNLTMGLFWIRPWDFPTLDSNSRAYIQERCKLGIPKTLPDSAAYLELTAHLLDGFESGDLPVKSFLELSHEAWKWNSSESSGSDSDQDGSAPNVSKVSSEFLPYSVSDIVAEGCFSPEKELEQYLDRLRSKKNLILQGPPGTGKTWLARKLAMALVGFKDRSRVRSLQFHPNLSYEDFVRGWRPSGDGKLELTDGPFIEAIDLAKSTPGVPFVIVIEEINRGNPAQILGEMLTLLEADKRSPEHALELSYRKIASERIHLPENLFVIGTMNIADRSLAIVDFALRRRFAFIDLAPRMGPTWRKWVMAHNGIEEGLANFIELKVKNLNELICADSTLGPAFQIGHSYFTPSHQVALTNAKDWYQQVVITEVGPLLDEYWFDALGKSAAAKEELLTGL